MPRPSTAKVLSLFPGAKEVKPEPNCKRCDDKKRVTALIIGKGPAHTALMPCWQCAQEEYFNLDILLAIGEPEAEAI